MHNQIRTGLKTILICLLTLINAMQLNAESEAPIKKTERMIVVIGAGGLEEYEQQFSRWSQRWKQIAAHKQAELTVIGESVDARQSDLELITRELQRQTDNMTATWLILIGHGTFDGKTARFNLRGPDLTADQLSQSCDAVKHPLAVLNCFSSSGPFLNALSADNRVIISATKNGHEFYFSRFGNFLSEASSQPQADLDHDGQISLLEAYLAACRETNAYYQEKGELATEHALLDDNADQQGTRGDQFEGLNRMPDSHSEKTTLPDGHRAHQFTLFATQPIAQISGEQKLKRDELELQILALKQRKTEFSNSDEYYQKLEPLMLQLALVYRRIDQKQQQIIFDPMVVPINAKKTGR
ncbi:hypothetical protein Pan241w_24700 [Gimesia alba]|uniref:Caspase domain protein n=1 Tax=Gimesia alba TaxID=2527973 RepID=A0A517RET8_9PLAN|nr:hypothetical protein [Gimesia alba]QDT42386.1 hypothetical protein Pan241w_24700 [Gimesia alba]